MDDLLGERAADQDTLAVLGAPVGRPAQALGVIEQISEVRRGGLALRPPHVRRACLQSRQFSHPLNLAPAGGSLALQSRRDAVEPATQPELETLVPGGRIVRVDARFHQPGDPRIPAGSLKPLVIALPLDRKSTR